MILKLITTLDSESHTDLKISQPVWNKGEISLEMHQSDTEYCQVSEWHFNIKHWMVSDIPHTFPLMQTKKLHLSRFPESLDANFVPLLSNHGGNKQFLHFRFDTIYSRNFQSFILGPALFQSQGFGPACQIVTTTTAVFPSKSSRCSSEFLSSLVHEFRFVINCKEKKN